MFPFLESLYSRKGPHSAHVEGFEFVVYDDVFPPCADTHLLARNIPRDAGETLDIGCGCGVNGIVAALRGSPSGVSVDISRAAVENARENKWKYGAQIDVRQSNMFNRVPTGQYALIVANGPHLEGRVRTPLDHGCYGSRKFNEQLLGGARAFMDRSSVMYVVYARLDGHDDFFESLLQPNGLHGEIIDSCRRPKGRGSYVLYQIKRK